MFERFKQRSYELERLDTGDYTPAEYARWEREMPWIHRFMGEGKALRDTLVRDVRRQRLREMSILDVGAGSGGILKLVAKMLPDVELLPIAVEMNDIAIATIRSEKTMTRIVPLKADGLRLPFADKSVEYVICTLFLHHLNDSDAEKLISEMHRVARRSFYAVDLNRHPVGYYAYRIFSPLFLQKFTQEDGALSILRSFTAGELLNLAKQSGVEDARVTHSRANRLVLSRR
jgi:ubiquinone/menaquinone biosynthesis C-methylase UbiE